MEPQTQEFWQYSTFTVHLCSWILFSSELPSSHWTQGTGNHIVGTYRKWDRICFQHAWMSSHQHFANTLCLCRTIFIQGFLSFCLFWVSSNFAREPTGWAHSSVKGEGWVECLKEIENLQNQLSKSLGKELQLQIACLKVLVKSKPGLFTLQKEVDFPKHDVTSLPGGGLSKEPPALSTAPQALPDCKENYFIRKETPG